MGITPNSAIFTILLGVLAGLPVLSIDISAPTLVLLPHALGTTVEIAGLTLSMFMAGFAGGQLAGGYGSDHWGRRPVLLVSLCAFILAGLGCTVAASGASLVLFRFLQGIGAGACSVLAFALVQDLFPPETARTKRSYVAVVFGVVPILAPALGALMSEAAGWRSVHAVLVLLGAGLLAIVLPVSRHWSTPSRALTVDGTRFRLLWQDGVFLRLTATNALSYACIFAYIAGSPILIMNHRGLSSSTFAAVFACTAIALSLGAWSSGRLIARGVNEARLLTLCFIVTCMATAALVASSTSSHRFDLMEVTALIAIMFCRGVISPNLQHSAIERWGQQAGAASAMIGFSQLLAGALASGLVAMLLPGWGDLAVSEPMAALTLAATAIWLSLRRYQQRQPAPAARFTEM